MSRDSFEIAKDEFEYAKGDLIKAMSGTTAPEFDASDLVDLMVAMIDARILMAMHRND